MTHACTYRFLDGEVRLPSSKAIAISALVAVTGWVALTLVGLPAYLAWHFAATSAGAALITDIGVADVMSTPKATITICLMFGTIISLAYWLIA